MFSKSQVRFVARIFWLVILALPVLGFFVLMGLRVASYLRALMNATRRRLRRSPEYRFLCPNCLLFGGFEYACGSCERKTNLFVAESEDEGKCLRCHSALISKGRENIAAHCQYCFSACDLSVHHHRRVQVLGALIAGDLVKLGNTSDAVKKRSKGGVRYLMADDGSSLTYVLCLEDLTSTGMTDSRSALAAMEAVWVDAKSMDALRLGEVVDRFFVRAGLSESQAERLTVCVPGLGLDATCEHILKTRFGKLYCGVSAANFIPDRIARRGISLFTEPSPGIETPIGS